MDITSDSQAERLFSGLIGEQYSMLRAICPAAPEISRRVGEVLASLQPGKSLSVFEIGCGTGITTLSLLLARENLSVLAVDNEPSMLRQAQQNLSQWIGEGRLQLQAADALSGLLTQPDDSLDVVASGYAIHNFLQGYRLRVLEQVFRVLKPGGVLINGDRYALDDSIAHTRLTQNEVRHWFKVFSDMNRLDLLEQWIVHLFSDESSDHLMRLTPAIDALRQIGFDPVEILHRDGVNAVLTAVKPKP